MKGHILRNCCPSNSNIRSFHSFSLFFTRHTPLHSRSPTYSPAQDPPTGKVGTSLTRDSRPTQQRGGDDDDDDDDADKDGGLDSIKCGQSFPVRFHKSHTASLVPPTHLLELAGPRVVVAVLANQYPRTLANRMKQHEEGFAYTRLVLALCKR